MVGLGGLDGFDCLMGGGAGSLGCCGRRRRSCCGSSCPSMICLIVWRGCSASADPSLVLCIRGRYPADGSGSGETLTAVEGRAGVWEVAVALGPDWEALADMVDSSGRCPGCSAATAMVRRQASLAGSCGCSRGLTSETRIERSCGDAEIEEHGESRSAYSSC